MTQTIDPTAVRVNLIHHFQAVAKISDQNIADILISAFEGGSNYWVASVKLGVAPKHKVRYCSNALSEKATLKIADAEDNGKVHELTTDAMLKGIVMAAEHMGKSVKSFIENSDAGDADVALQFALFDEIIYG